MTSLKALPRAAWILFLGTFLNKFGTFVIPFLVIYMTRQGYSPGEAALTMGAYGAGHFVACAIGGYLADRIGRRKTIALSMFSGAASMVLLSQATHLWSITLLAGLTGLTGELYRPASSALLADLVPAGQRVTAYAAYRMAFNAGWAFGPATAGFLAGHSFLWLFLGDALTSALFGVVALVALPHGLRNQHTESGWPEALASVVRNKRFHRVLLSSMAIALVFFQMSSTFGLHVTGLGLSSTTYGALLSWNGVLVVCFELLLTTFTQRLPARRTMAVGYVLIGAGFALNAFARTAPAFAFAMTIFTLGEMVAMPVSSAYIADLAPAHMRGRYMGMFGLTWALALVAGPSLGMMAYARSPMLLWLGCGGLGLLAAFIILGEGEPDAKGLPLEEPTVADQ
jgi:MFS family permease